MTKEREWRKAYIQVDALWADQYFRRLSKGVEVKDQKKSPKTSQGGKLRQLQKQAGHMDKLLIRPDQTVRHG